MFVTEKVKHLFSYCYKSSIISRLRHQITVLKEWISFESTSLLNVFNHTVDFYNTKHVARYNTVIPDKKGN